MKTKFFGQRYAWFIVGFSVVFAISFAVFETVIQPKIKQTQVKAKIEEIASESSKAAEIGLEGVEKLKQYRQLESEYKVCVSDTSSAPDTCYDIATKSRSVLVEIDQLKQQMNYHNYKSF